MHQDPLQRAMIVATAKEKEKEKEPERERAGRLKYPRLPGANRLELWLVVVVWVLIAVVVAYSLLS